MPKVNITDVAGKELSLIFEKFKGEAWSPVNGDARVITTKGQPDKPRKALLETIKGYFYPAGDAAVVNNSWPVGEEVPDNIDGDGDGDGAQDYSAYALAITGAAYDINQAMYLSEPARSQAIVAVVDEFRKGAQATFGASEKGGKRHSAADLKHLQAIKEHVDALLPADSNDAETEEQKAARVSAEESLKAFVVGEPREGACEKFGVEISDEKGSPLTPPAANGEAAPNVDVAALIQKAVADATVAFDAKLETAKSEVRDQAEARIAAVETAANERVEKAEAGLAQTKAQLDKANASLKALVGDARKPSAGGFVATINEDGSKNDPAKESVKAEAEQALKGASSIAQVIQLQRIANS